MLLLHAGPNEQRVYPAGLRYEWFEQLPLGKDAFTPANLDIPQVSTCCGWMMPDHSHDRCP